MNNLLKHVDIFTDGGCLGNPGPGGYAAILVYRKARKEVFGGFRLTTNNRMELYACIAGLELLKYPCRVILSSDSRYVVDGMEKGWAKRWENNNWMRGKKSPAMNADLWARLLALCRLHSVRFTWIKGHAGHAENERCDHLAQQAAAGTNLPPDHPYEKGYANGPSALSYPAPGG